MTARAPPRGVIYGGLPPAGALATRRLVQFLPTTDATYKFSGQNVFTIPINGPFWLDAKESYLSFDIEVKGASAATAGTNQCPAVFMNSSAHNVFNQLEILGPSENRIETIANYNQVACAIHDARAGGEDDLASAGKGCGLIARRAGIESSDFLTNQKKQCVAKPFNSPTSGVVGDTTAELTVVTQGKTSEISEGHVFQTAATAGATTVTDASGIGSTMRVTLKLCSGVLNTDKFIPLISMVGKGLQLRFQLENPSVALSAPAGDATTQANDYRAMTELDYQLTNVRYFASVVSMDDAINRQFLDILSSQQLVQAHTESYLYSMRPLTVAADTSESLFNINARSLNALIAWQTPTDAVSSISQDGIGFRFRDGVDSFQFRVNGVNYPESRVELTAGTSDISLKSVYGCSRALQEWRKAWGVYPYADKASRNTAASFGVNGFYMAQSLKAYPHDFSVIESGIDTATSATPIYFSVTRKSRANYYNTSFVTGLNVCMLGLCDMIVSYQFNGTAVASV
mgnify:FL=1